MTTQSTISLIEIVVPDLGEIKDVPVIEVLVRVGEKVEIDQTLVVLETEKATMDVPSASAGIIRDVIVKVGDTVSVGSALAIVEALGSEVERLEEVVATPPSLSHTAPALAVPAPRTIPVASGMNSEEQLPSPGDGPPHASPSVRRFAREFGLDLSQVRGSGPKGRILHSDLQTFIKTAVASPEATRSVAKSYPFDLPPWPQVDFAKFGPVERIELSKIKKISGASLARNATVIPHVTNFDESDVTELEAFRLALNHELAAKGSKLTMLAFLIKASVTALKEHPMFNASLDGEYIILKRYFHIGFATDTPNGLVVPVICDADTKGLLAIAEEVSMLAEQARNGKLKPTDMQGGSFTVSSLGGIGGTGFTPIINAPEVAILGAARASMKPVWNGEQFQPRLMMPLNLSWDHRVIDGAAAARFLNTLRELLADFRRAML
jgi:pyruvate dehydrogenase E2 component (dihydrolipoamide acetyltransferase)